MTSVDLKVKKFLPSLVALVSVCLLAFLGYLISAKNQDEAERVRFINFAQQIDYEIESRLRTYQNVLVQTRGLFYVTQDVSKAEFSRYIQSLNIFDQFPGLQGIGYTERIKAKDLAPHLRKHRKINPSYQIWPTHKRKDYFSIIYLEPQNWRNQRAIGYDMFTEEIRHKAMSAARDLNTPAMTSLVTLVQETNEDPQAGFLIYAPVYSQPDDLSSLESRRKKLNGFVYAPFRTSDLFQSILKRFSQEQFVNVEIYADGELLFSDHNNADKARYKQISSFTLASKTWTIKTTGHLAFKSSFIGYLPLLILFSGLILGLFVFIFMNRMIREAELRAELLARTQEALRARDEFLSVASHELKTPITSLMLLFQITNRGMKLGEQTLYNPENVQRRVTTALNQLERMNKLIDDMLESSRFATKKLKLELFPIEFNEVIRRCLEIFDDQFKALGIEYTLSLTPEKTLMMGDAFRLEQVISNLLTNVIKYGRKMPFEMRTEVDKGKILLVVKDQGIGIPATALDKIFDRFERAISSHEISGLGLGLYISGQIVAMHQGRIWVESEVGKGSTFYVEFNLLEDQK
jgi:two-component system, OmpR family, sensor kinase